MSSKGYLISIPGIMLIILALSSFVLVQDVNGTAPEVNSITYEPLAPTVDDEFNITVVYDVYDEPITSAHIQVCIDGICFNMDDMEGDGSGDTFWKVYAPNSFPAEETIEFHFFLDYGQGLKSIHAENVIFDPVPHDVYLNGTLSENTLKPDQAVTVDGNLTFDIGGPVEGADINLSIASLGIFNTTMTDTGGNFSVDLSIPDEGEYTLVLNATLGEMIDHMEWTVTVSPWDLPNIGIEFDEIQFQEMDSPPGTQGNVFYVDSNVTLAFNIHNTGNDEARNITASIAIENASVMDDVDAGDLLPSERYPGTYLLNTSMEGHFEVNITADWEQSAPMPEGFTPPTLNINYDIVPRPEWTGHTVFVEMFTQTTCGPCVYVEESLEKLYHEGVDFEFIVYVTGDTESGLIAEGRDIIATPVLFVDDDLFRKDGSTDVLEDEMDEIRGMIEDAASLERPPVSMNFTNGETVTLNSYLDPEYRDTVSGIIEIYRIEAHSNLRNYQDLPMSHRYLGSVAGQEVNGMQPGGWFNFSVDKPADGEALVAVLVDDDGTVIQTTTYSPMEEPIGYLGTDQVVLNIESSDQASFNLTLERFQTEDTTFEDIDVLVTERGFPAGWNIGYSTGSLSPPGVMMTLSYDEAEKETKPVGRFYYSLDNLVTLTVPENVSGTFNFDIVVEIGNYTYSMLVVVIVPEPGAPDIVVTDSYLVGEGKTIFFYVEASGVPDGALVKGRILPCNYGPDAACGLPVDFLLTKTDDGVYRASVIGVDLSTFTHLTYSAWVENDNIDYSKTEGVQVEIDSLVNIEADDDNGDTEISPWVFIFSIAALFIAVGLAVILFVLAKRSSKEEPVEEIVGEPYQEETSSSEVPIDEVSEGEINEEEVVNEVPPPEEGVNENEISEDPVEEEPVEE